MKISSRTSEWLLVGSLILVMISLVAISKINSRRAFSSLSAAQFKQETILVTIEGAVVRPGIYPVLAGSLIKEVLRKAKPKPYADIQKIAMNQVVEVPLHITVEELTEVTVSVQGAVVSPTKIALPVRSRICNLKGKIELTPDADKTFLRRKKMLKNGEIIVVPKKTVEDNSVDCLCSHTDI